MLLVMQLGARLVLLHPLHKLKHGRRVRCCWKADVQVVLIALLQFPGVKEAGIDGVDGFGEIFMEKSKIFRNGSQMAVKRSYLLLLEEKEKTLKPLRL